MQLLHDDSFINLVKTAILIETKGFTPVHESLCSEGVKVNDYSLRRCLLEWEWLHTEPCDVTGLKNAVELFVLHKYKDYELIFRIIREALIKGCEHVLLGKSRESKLFCVMINSVRRELYNASIYSSFKESDNKLYCNYFFSHEINSLLKKQLSKRFPNKEIVINNPLMFPKNLRGDVTLKSYF